MKKTIQIDYGDWDVATTLIKKLKELGILSCNEYGNEVEIKKSGTLIIEFVEE